AHPELAHIFELYREKGTDLGAMQDVGIRTRIMRLVDISPEIAMMAMPDLSQRERDIYDDIARRTAKVGLEMIDGASLTSLYQIEDGEHRFDVPDEDGDFSDMTVQAVLRVKDGKPHAENDLPAIDINSGRRQIWCRDGEYARSG